MDKEKNKILEYEAICAFRVLCNEISSIRYVRQWAEKAGCSVNKLSLLIKGYYGLSPKKLLKQVRYGEIYESIKSAPTTTSYCVAESNGLKNEQDLYNFLSRNFGVNYTYLRHQILLSEFENETYE